MAFRCSAPGMARGAQAPSDQVWCLIGDFDGGKSRRAAFVAEPQTNGVAERFYRTLKEQVIYGRNYRTVQEVRVAVADFMDRYNRQWLIEKLGFRSP